MLAAMTHPSRVLNSDMKAKALYAKELYLYIYIYIYILTNIYIYIYIYIYILRKGNRKLSW